MKILFLSHKFYPFIGGIEVNSEVLAGEFSKAGHEVTLVTWSEDNSNNKIFPYTVIRKPALKQLIALHRATDVVYENNPSLRLSWPVLFTRKKIVIAIRTWVRRIEGGMALQDYLKLWWLKRANATIAISEAIRLQASKKATVIGNPFRKDLFVNKGMERTRDFVFLGRLVSNKGADHAVLALSKVIKQPTILDASFTKSITLTIIGDGPELVQLKALVLSLQLENNVHFTGALQGEALVEALNLHRYILVPSLWEEPFGNVALEGMACGCIPIVSDGGGLPDAVGNAGLVFIREDVAGLTEAMMQVLVDKTVEEKLKLRAIKHLENHFPEVVGGRYLAVIEQSLKKRM